MYLHIGASVHVFVYKIELHDVLCVICVLIHNYDTQVLCRCLGEL